MTFELKYRLTYEGGEADNNRLPAHQGAISLEGITWSFDLLAHYAATGRIRARGELSPLVRLYLSPARQGSYIHDLTVFLTEPNNLFLTTAIGSYAVATIGQVVNSLVVSTFRQVCGLAEDLAQKDDQRLSRLPSGDREALIDKVEAPMKRAHAVIEDGASTLLIKKGYTPLLTLDAATKAYVNADLLTDEKVWMASVGAYNANSGNGRVYLPAIGKTVPFFAPKGLDANTYAAISLSLDRYVNGLGSIIEMAGTESLSLDGRIKKLIISRAFKPN
ncbi:hypothetical protein [Rhizobium indigoferae]|uniref:Uncharacterized protein n=1 Tax=Rhizobium indigoferae TaxID=158891 RepID=A0ABZ0Z6F6_9HYPH|nr:hypothetical protein [Rhizobium indigoferae]NNU57222.1 hypothetical protein [Rhizobium indigoferae]WQN35148.1 hypothetical protein U5G49_000171 [Rhizobium indigoferae]GLR60285.1 hypothetical protein GCM10007919_50130 [Rhizobium indigoferae]